MGRPPRIQFEDAVYHIYPRGNRRERIAHSDRDYRILERYFIEAALKMGVQARAWYPMPNHFHAALQTPLGNLSAFMQAWLSRYARYYNWTYRKVGHVFQGRFGSRLVQTDLYLKELIRYIALQRHRAKNPVRIDPYCDRYASHRFYMGETCPPHVGVWIAPMLDLFGSSLPEARRNYAKFLADGLKEGSWENFYKPKNDVVGSEAFMRKVELRRKKTERIVRLPPWRCRQVLTVLIRATADLFALSEAELKSVSQRRSVCRARQAIVYVGRRLGLRVSELAAALHRGSPAVSMMIQAGMECPLPEFETLYERINSDL